MYFKIGLYKTSSWKFLLRSSKMVRTCHAYPDSGVSMQKVIM